jgi:hypothetical protein
MVFKNRRLKGESMKAIRKEQSHLESLLERVNDEALMHNDGHVTIMGFTTGWKVLYGTPVELMGSKELLSTRQFFSLEEALENSLIPTRLDMVNPKILTGKK